MYVLKILVNLSLNLLIIIKQRECMSVHDSYPMDSNGFIRWIALSTILTTGPRLTIGHDSLRMQI